ncbi:MAG: hypothetical protein HY094_02430 [Candidatus Melainabacteria bacterium]|nr:hypothetical protein [Candidatus Melainabacteria bacterium]
MSIFITPTGPRITTPLPVRGKAANPARAAASTVNDYLKTGTNTFMTMAKLFSGGICMTIGLTAEHILKDSWLDRFSKLIALFGTVILGWGVFDVFKLFKNSKEIEIVREPCELAPNNNASFWNKCKKSESKLLALDPSFASDDFSGLISSNTSVSKPSIVGKAGELLRCYSDEEMIDLVSKVKGGSEPDIKEISKAPVKLSTYKDRVTELLGFCKANLSSVAPDVTTRIGEILGASEIDGKYKELLSEDFVVMYKFIKEYKEKYEEDARFSALIGGKEKIELLEKSLIVKSEGDTKEDTLKYLSSLQEAENYLQVLHRVITYVLDQSNLTNPNKARNVVILRQALICAFNLEGNNLNSINKELKKILNGEEATKKKGIKSKLEDLKKHFESERVSKVLHDENFAFRKQSDPIKGNEALSGLYWSRFSE